MHTRGSYYQGLKRKPFGILYLQPYNLWSGPHHTLRTLISNLDRSNYRPYVALPGPGEVASDFVECGAKVCFDPGILTVPRSFSPIIQLRFWLQSCASARRLAKLVQSEDIRLVHINSEACWVGGLAARLSNRPAIGHLRGLSVLSPAWIGKITTWFLNKHCVALIAVSNRVRDAYLSNGARRECLYKIYNGIDPEKFSLDRVPSTLRSELSLKENQPLVGMIANFDSRKGHHDFINASFIVLRKIPQAHFLIVGDLNSNKSQGYFKKLQELVSKLGVGKAIHFLGLRHDIPNILASMDVVVQPSLTEAGPVAPLEAMAMQRPIVVTDVGGNSEEVVDGETGLVVPVGDAVAIANAVLKLIRDPILAELLGKAGRERVLSMFTEEINAKKVQEVYEKLL